MSWKSRKRKAFFRYVEMLKAAPIHLIDQFIFIDEFVYHYKKNKIAADRNKKGVQLSYENYLKDGKIKGPFDFDNHFNPDLTLDIHFERDPQKANALIKKTLMQIGETWHQRLKNKFPDYNYTLVVYFNSEDSEWYLDFYNGVVKIEELDRSEKCVDVIYLSD